MFLINDVNLIIVSAGVLLELSRIIIFFSLFYSSSFFILFYFFAAPVTTRIAWQLKIVTNNAVCQKAKKKLR